MNLGSLHPVDLAIIVAYLAAVVVIGKRASKATTSEEAPGRLIVLGGGVVGVELGQAWATLGSQVTIVEASPRLLGREEEFAAKLVHESLVERGVEVRVGSPAVSAIEIDKIGNLFENDE